MKSMFSLHDMRRFVVLFYAIGVLGFLIPFTHAVFQRLIPLAIIVNVYLLWVNHEKMTTRDILVFAFIVISGFFIEVIGVATGFPFGDYSYGTVMGPQIFNTPLIIGFNWLMLAYCSYFLVDKLRINPWIKPIAGASLMLAYDFILEPMAKMLGMWNWEQLSVPPENYISWFVISLIYLVIMRFANIRIRNGIAVHIIVLQSCLIVFLVLFTYITES